MMKVRCLTSSDSTAWRMRAFTSLTMIVVITSRSRPLARRFLSA